MIVALCLFVLAGLANTAPVEVPTSCAAHFLRQVHAAPRADSPLWEF